MSQFNPAGGENDGFGPPVGRSQLPLWARLAELFWVYASLKMVVMLVFQHKYDVLMRELKQLNSTEPGAHSGDSSNLRQEKLTSELGVTIGRLEMIGNPVYELGSVVEIMLLFVLVVIYLGKMQPPLYVKLRGPVRIGAMQMLLDRDREHESATSRQICQLACKFSESLANYWHNRQEQTSALYRELQSSSDSGESMTLPLARHLTITREITRSQERTLDAIRDLVDGGQLVPPNRTALWARQFAQIYCGLLLGLWPLAVLVMTFLLLVLPYMGVLNRWYRIGPRGLLSHVELFLLFALGSHWISFDLILVAIIAIDQMKFYRELRHMIEQLIEDFNWRESIEPTLTNCCELATIITTEAETHAPQRPVSRELERRLLSVLTLYKLFKWQLRAAQPIVGFIGGHMAFLMLLLPIMGRLYGAYMTREEHFLLLLSALISILVGDLFVLPSCMIHARCLNIFGLMSQLLAHVDGLAAHTQSGKDRRQARDVCDAHTVWMLRKELHSHEMATRAFTTRAFFLRLTYGSWLGVHFWCGLLLAPLFMSDTARLGSAGVPLVESLGLF